MNDEFYRRGERSNIFGNLQVPQIPSEDLDESCSSKPPVVERRRVMNNTVTPLSGLGDLQKNDQYTDSEQQEFNVISTELRTEEKPSCSKTLQGSGDTRESSIVQKISDPIIHTHRCRRFNAVPVHKSDKLKPSMVIYKDESDVLYVPYHPETHGHFDKPCCNKCECSSHYRLKYSVEDRKNLCPPTPKACNICYEKKSESHHILRKFPTEDGTSICTMCQCQISGCGDKGDFVRPHENYKIRTCVCNISSNELLVHRGHDGVPVLDVHKSDAQRNYENRQGLNTLNEPAPDKDKGHKIREHHHGYELKESTAYHQLCKVYEGPKFKEPNEFKERHDVYKYSGSNESCHCCNHSNLKESFETHKFSQTIQKLESTTKIHKPINVHKFKEYIEVSNSNFVNRREEPPSMRRSQESLISNPLPEVIQKSNYNAQKFVVVSDVPVKPYIENKCDMSRKLHTERKLNEKIENKSNKQGEMTQRPQLDKLNKPSTRTQKTHLHNKLNEQTNVSDELNEQIHIGNEFDGQSENPKQLPDDVRRYTQRQKLRKQSDGSELHEKIKQNSAAVRTDLLPPTKRCLQKPEEQSKNTSHDDHHKLDDISQPGEGRIMNLEPVQTHAQKPKLENLPIPYTERHKINDIPEPNVRFAVGDSKKSRPFPPRHHSLREPLLQQSSSDTMYRLETKKGNLKDKQLELLPSRTSNKIKETVATSSVSSGGRNSTLVPTVSSNFVSVSMTEPFKKYAMKTDCWQNHKVTKCEDDAMQYANELNLDLSSLENYHTDHSDLESTLLATVRNKCQVPEKSLKPSCRRDLEMLVTSQCKLHRVISNTLISNDESKASKIVVPSAHVKKNVEDVKNDKKEQQCSHDHTYEKTQNGNKKMQEDRNVFKKSPPCKKLANSPVFDKYSKARHYKEKLSRNCKAHCLKDHGPKYDLVKEDNRSGKSTERSRSYISYRHSHDSRKPRAIPKTKRESDRFSVDIDELVNSRVINPMIRRMQHVYLNNLKQEMMLIQELETLPTKVRSLYRNIVYRKKADDSNKTSAHRYKKHSVRNIKNN